MQVGNTFAFFMVLLAPKLELHFGTECSPPKVGHLCGNLGRLFSGFANISTSFTHFFHVYVATEQKHKSFKSLSSIHRGHVPPGAEEWRPRSLGCQR